MPCQLWTWRLNTFHQRPRADYWFWRERLACCLFCTFLAFTLWADLRILWKFSWISILVYKGATFCDRIRYWLKLCSGSWLLWSHLILLPNIDKLTQVGPIHCLPQNNADENWAKTFIFQLFSTGFISMLARHCCVHINCEYKDFTNKIWLLHQPMKMKFQFSFQVALQKFFIYCQCFIGS